MDDNGLDEAGFIRSVNAVPKIPVHFTDLIETVRRAIESAFEHQLHSIYVYGSVASGKALAQSSDLDIFIVFEKDLSSKVRAEVVQLADQLSQRFQSEVREVGLAAASLAEILEGDNQVGWGCFIKHMCVCLSGEDLADQLPKFKPTRAVAYGLNGDLKQEMETARRILLEGSDDAKNKTKMSISRKMVRSAFCLVIEEAQCWTTDLNDCSSIFIQYYPQCAPQIQLILPIAKGASLDSDQFLSLLNGFGDWLCDEVDRQLRPTGSRDAQTERI